jgi:hypothetical protein
MLGIAAALVLDKKRPRGQAPAMQPGTRGGKVLIS